MKLTDPVRMIFKTRKRWRIDWKPLIPVEIGCEVFMEVLIVLLPVFSEVFVKVYVHCLDISSTKILFSKFLMFGAFNYEGAP